MKLLGVFLLAAAVCAEKVRYDGYSVLEVTPKTEFHNQLLLELQVETDVDFWLEPTRGLTPVHIMVPPQNYQGLRAAFEQAGMDVAIHIEDVQEQFDEVERNLPPTNRAFDYDNYNDFDAYQLELAAFATDCPAGFSCSVNTIGSSYEGRPMNVLVMDSGRNNGRSLWVDSLIHAREWLAGATTMRVFNETVRGNSADANFIRDRYDFIYYLPVMNPDGFVYTYTNRNWRKNRTPNLGSSCLGTDLNRNYPFQWNTGGSSDLPCSDTYHGESAASEPETVAVVDFINGLSTEFEVFMTFHTYGYYWLVPYGNCSYPRNEDNIVGVADDTARAIEAVYGTTWRDGNSCRVLYATSGSTADWAQGEVEALYSYTPELRGNSFSPPATQILPSYREIWAGLGVQFRAIAAREGN